MVLNRSYAVEPKTFQEADYKTDKQVLSASWKVNCVGPIKLDTDQPDRADKAFSYSKKIRSIRSIRVPKKN
jgi:hypothetical protein